MENKITHEHIRKFVQERLEFMQDHPHYLKYYRDRVKRLLGKYDCRAISFLPPDKLQPFYDELIKL